MNVVLYTDDMLPITVLDLSHGQFEFLKKNGRMRLHVLRPLTALDDASRIHGCEKSRMRLVRRAH